MYPISPAFQRVLNARIGRNRYIAWRGKITLVNGVKYDFTTDDIVQGSGIVSHTCDVPFVGGAFSKELKMATYLNIDPRLLKNAIIDLTVRLISVATANSWEEASIFSWSDLSSTHWGDTSREIYADVPVGVFIVKEAKRSMNSIKIEAYDNMTKFDAPLPQMDTRARSPFDWLRWMCSLCKVDLGMTNAQIREFTNGTRTFTYADVGNINTCRDLISQLSAVLGAIAVIDRYGRLILAKFSGESVAEITRDDRFSSEYADYQSYYTGLSAEYRAKATREYYKNVRTSQDDGLIIDIGTNVFVQISNDSNRAASIQAIINAFKNMRFTPFDVSIPFHPEYDLLDTLTFTGGHAPSNSHAPITSISMTFGGSMTLKCGTPKEEDNPVRETTQSSGVSGGGTGGFYASTDFWIKIASFPESATVIGDDTVTTELTIDCTVEHNTTQIAWTGAYTLDEAAKVTVKVMVDSEVVYQVSDVQTAGDHILNVTTGYEIDGTGEHSIRVILSETPTSPDEGGGGGDNGGQATGGSQTGSGDDTGTIVISEPVDDPVEEVGEHELTP